MTDGRFVLTSLEGLNVACKGLGYIAGKISFRLSQCSEGQAESHEDLTSSQLSFKELSILYVSGISGIYTWKRNFILNSELQFSLCEKPWQHVISCRSVIILKSQRRASKYFKTFFRLYRNSIYVKVMPTREVTVLGWVVAALSKWTSLWMPSGSKQNSHFQFY